MAITQPSLLALWPGQWAVDEDNNTWRSEQTRALIYGYNQRGQEHVYPDNTNPIVCGVYVLRSRLTDSHSLTESCHAQLTSQVLPLSRLRMSARYIISAGCTLVWPGDHGGLGNSGDLRHPFHPPPLAVGRARCPPCLIHQGTGYKGVCTAQG